MGFDTQGNAYAGKKGEKTTVPSFTFSKDEADSNLDASMYRPHAATWVNGVIDLNINEIQQRISQEDKWLKGAHSSEAWAYYLNMALRNGVTNIGVRHLLLGISKANLGMSAFQYGLIGAVEALSDHPSLESLASKVVIVPVMINLFQYLSLRNTDYGYRWS